MSGVDGGGEGDGDGEDGGRVPESSSGVEDDGRTRRQMVHSSTGRSTSCLWVKGGGGQNV